LTDSLALQLTMKVVQQRVASTATCPRACWRTERTRGSSFRAPVAGAPYPSLPLARFHRGTYRWGNWASRRKETGRWGCCPRAGGLEAVGATSYSQNALACRLKTSR